MLEKRGQEALWTSLQNSGKDGWATRLIQQNEKKTNK